MSWMPPILGLDYPEPDGWPRITWHGDDQVCGGILGAVFDPEAQGRWDAEQKHKQQLRDQNVAVLSDFRKEDFNGC